MINETEKLNNFKNAVFKDADSRVKELIDSAEMQAQEKISKAHQQAESYENQQFAKAEREETSASVKEISAGQLEFKRKVLIHREQLMDKVFDDVKNRLDKFCQSADYEKWLAEKVRDAKDALKGEKGIIYLCGKDMKFAEKLEKLCGFDVCESRSFELGGIMIVFEEKNAVFDYTFDSALEEQKSQFIKKYNVSLDGMEGI